MRVFVSLLLLIGLTGCASNVVMSGRQVSNVDPDASIDSNDRIRIEAVNGDDPLTNKRYLENVAQAFHAKGYHYVGANLSQPDVIARFNLTSQNQVREVEQPIYEERRTGHSTSCYRTEKGTQRCDTDFHVMPYLVGYETVKVSVLEAKMDLELADTNGKLILHSTSSVEHDACSRWKLYEFLVQRTIKNLNFDQPMDQPFSIEMPEDYQCTDAL